MPTTDDFDSAAPIGAVPFGDAQDTSEATTAHDDPDCSGNGHTVWYSFAPASDLDVVVHTQGSDYDTTLSVYTGQRGSLAQVACNDDFDGLLSRVGFHAAGGTTYYLMVGSYRSSPGGNLQLRVETPSPDDFDAAAPIGSIPFSAALDTTDATTAGDDPWCAGNGHTVWYSFTPSSDVDVAVLTAGSDYDTTVSIYTGSRGSLAQVACNDDFGGLQSGAAFHALGGTTYYVMVGSYSTTRGGQLHLSVDVAPPPADIAVTFDRSGSVNKDGVATIKGTMGCNQPLTVYLYLTVDQKSVRHIHARGSGGTVVECVPSGIAWELPASSHPIPFFPGTATVEGDAYTCNLWGCTSQHATGDVKLRRTR